MASPTVVDIPHSLGREEAIRRIRARIGELPGHIPGGMADVTATWPEPDRMALAVAALGQKLSATIEVQETLVRVAVVLPGLLSFMSGPITAAIRSKGGELLLDDKRGG